MTSRRPTVVAAAAWLLFTGNAWAGLDHLRLLGWVGQPQGYTCQTFTVTVQACSDSSCATPYTGGVSGAVSATSTSHGSTGIIFSSSGAWSIAPGASSTTLTVDANVNDNWFLSLAGLSQTPAAATRCNTSGTVTQPCGRNIRAATLMPNTTKGPVNSSIRVAGVPYDMQVDLWPAACSGLFASGSVERFYLSCSPIDPSTNTLSPTALVESPSNGSRQAGWFNAAHDGAQACDATQQPVDVAVSGALTVFTLRDYVYPDTGFTSLGLTYHGRGNKTGMVLTSGLNSYYVPSSLVFGSVPSGELVAGRNYNMTLTAMAGSAPAPSFMKDSYALAPALTFARTAPTGSSAFNGTSTGSVGTFTNGTAQLTGFSWSEVGSGTLTAAAKNSMATAPTGYGQGSTSLGPFIPDRLMVTVAGGCGSFSYSGQQATLGVTAKNANGGTTFNFDGTSATSPNQAKTVQAFGVSSGPAFTPYKTMIAASSFVSGSASVMVPYTLTATPSAPATITPTAESVEVTSFGAAKFAGVAPYGVNVRQGRLAITDATAYASSPAIVPLTAQTWNGSAWAHEAADDCTWLDASHFALGQQYRADGQPTATTVTKTGVSFSGGQGQLTLAAPADGSSAVISVAANLGATTATNNCAGAPYAASTGALASHLRSRQSCNPASWTGDPSATVRLGMPMPRSAADVWVSDRR